MIKQLRVKFICINMLIVSVMLGVILGMVLHFTSNSMQMESTRRMQAAAEMRGPHPGPRSFFLVVDLDRNGSIVKTTGEDYDYTQDEIEQLVLTALKEQKPMGVLEQYDLRYCRGRDRVVFGDISAERNMLTNLVRDCLIIGLVSLLAFFFISLLLARWAVRPVEQAWEQQRQFVADASHELKTPLTVILTNAELLQSPDYDPAQKKTFSQSILTMSNQMRGLVEMLLQQARVDAGVITAAKICLDPAPFVAEAVMTFEALFYEKGLALESELEEGLHIKGSGAHLRQLTEIFLDNAMKYSLPGTTRVRLYRHGHHAVLSVSNPGDPIAPDDLRNIFKRFYRADTARSMNGSYGLGLSIAAGIVKDHGGKIKAESENGMNTFTVSIPLMR
ncbi:MAG: HAMP domain-containing histidine kinase [Oscillospiraceae bacterium]|nr:HAMP domain-containing histidine kinase [Oscillospiraceae bacterium]